MPTRSPSCPTRTPPLSNRLDPGWLRIGIRLGLERPGQARRLLELIGSQGVPAPLADGDSGAPSIPPRSFLLARAAALPPSERASAGPEIVFGWASGLAPAEILLLGRVVGDMLASGASPDIGKGFGLAWTAGIKVPRPELDVMLQEFADLEVTVGSALAGRELRTSEPASRPTGVAAWLSDWVPRSRPGESQAAAMVERNGEPARLGLVALWNAWMAMRHRALMPEATFELLVQPWVTVVGPLPG